MTTRTGVAILAVIATVGGWAAAAIIPAAADTTGDLNAARKVYADAQAAATAASAALFDAETHYDEVSAHVSDLQAGLDQARQQEATLAGIVQSRVLFAYIHSAGTDPIFAGLSPENALRSDKYLNATSASSNHAIDELTALRADLRTQQDELQREQARAAQVEDQLAASSQAVQAQLAEAAKARDALAAQLAAEQTAAAAAERARLVSGTCGGPCAPGQIIVNPGGGPFQCPVSGAAYDDNYGPRGSGFHYGIDMSMPPGAPEVAVKAGSVSYAFDSTGGGNVAYLAANDGNVYFYAHLSAFVGSARSVAQGEVIGLVGQTGDAQGPHLHFEIRVGGINGQRIDPFPTLQAAGC